MRGGAFVVVEGIEASGKSTLLAGLDAALRERGVPATLTREPGGTPLGDRVRAVFLERELAIEPLAEAFLIFASRAQHVAQVIAPALARGDVVLCDRFDLATFAYQGFGRGLDLAFLRAASAVAARDLQPALTLVVDVPLEVSLARMRARDARPDRLEAERLEFHARVRAGYLELARTRSDAAVLDGTLAPGELLAQALRHVDRALDLAQR